MPHMHLWSSMMMQYIRTKEAEENWSLHQYIFLAGSRKTVPLACRSGDWIKIPMQSSRRLQELTYLRAFLSILLAESQRLHFPPPARSKMETTYFNFQAWPHCCHCVVSGCFEVSKNNCWKNIHTKF